MTGSDNGAVSFGPFQLFPSTRRLERDGVDIALGDRALDILIALVERAGEIVSHRDLIARAWRDLVVGPGNLRVHMTALRKALGEGEDGVRYIANVAGQGYTFVAPVKRTGGEPVARRAPLTVIAPSVLPPALARMVGRDDAVRTIAADLRTDRFVTIVGAGGMGKTTVAISVAHAMLEEFAGEVCFLDLGALADPKLLAATIASTLGLPIQSADPLATLMAFLRTTRMLLLLDNCEHVIDAVAPLAEMIFRQAPEVHILATSREALRVEGEHAHWLRPLESPPPDANVNAASAMTFPAVRLFVDRAKASDSRFELTDANARIVADICSRLDGIALALEFVAGRVGTHGLEGTAALLNKRLGLHWQGRRTALPRHQTLHSLLDWSYSLLSTAEQHVLRRLSLFVGTFALEAAQAVASDAELNEAQLACVVDQLISKSLLSAIKTHAGTTCYRLLETTRLYAIKRLEECGDEMDATAERHARYFTRLLKPDSGGACRSTRHEHLGNLRAALEWCFGDRGASSGSRTALGIDLAAVSVSTFLDLSLWNECRRWSEAALAVLPAATRGDRRELVLQEALAISSLLTNSTEARTAIERGLEIARQLGEAAIRFRLLGALHVYVLRMTDFKSSVPVAEEMESVAKETNDLSRRAIADWMLGSSQYVLGNPAESKRLFESGFSYGVRAADADQQLGGLYYRTRALYGLARVQWLCGFPDRALHSARQSMIEAAETGSPVSVSYSLVYSCYVFLWCGDLETAQEMNETVMSQPHWQGRLMWFHAEALALKGELLVRRGKLEAGIELLRETLANMQSTSQKNLMLSVTACCLAEALAATGRADEALTVINDAIALAPGGAETWDAPELFRIKAIVLLAMPRPDEARAENCLMQSLALARHQGAIGWELRAAITMARLRVSQGRSQEAREMLSKIYDRFTEGFQTQDLKAAAALLAQLGAAPAPTSPSLSSADAAGSYPQ